jgi:hypothetical protein
MTSTEIGIEIWSQTSQKLALGLTPCSAHPNWSSPVYDFTTTAPQWVASNEEICHSWTSKTVSEESKNSHEGAKCAVIAKI